jgi:hypothetical protein
MNKEYNVKAKVIVDISFTVRYAEEMDVKSLCKNIERDCENEAFDVAEKLGSVDSIKEYGVEEIVEVLHNGTGESNDPSIYEVRNDILNAFDED